MRYSIHEGLFWLCVFLFLHALLLILFAVDPPEDHRGFLAEFGTALGFTGMTFMIAQFVTTGRFQNVAPGYGADLVLHFHKYAGVSGVVLVLLHPVLLFISDPSYLRFYNPADDFFRAAGLLTLTAALIVIIATSIRGVPGWLNYEQWRLAHAGLAVLIVFIGMVHGLQVSNYLDTIWKQLIWVSSVVIAVGLLAEVRLFRPLRMKKHPWKLVSVKPEQGDAYTIELEPDGHDGMEFKAGQFAWITVGESPFQLQQNPFSIASANGEQNLKFTAAVAGDFTASWKNLKPGTNVWIDGPYGSFTVPEESKGLYFISGGSGIVPAMSILRTMALQGDRRPAILLYGNPSEDQILFQEELEELTGKLNLKVIHFLENTNNSSRFNEGFIDKRAIETWLPNDENRYSYYCCGPAPLMDKSEKALRELGVGWRRIIPERFDII